MTEHTRTVQDVIDRYRREDKWMTGIIVICILGFIGSLCLGALTLQLVREGVEHGLATRNNLVHIITWVWVATILMSVGTVFLAVMWRGTKREVVKRFDAVSERTGKVPGT